MVNTFQISNGEYLHVLLPSVYSIRKTFPPGTNIYVALVTMTIPDDVLKILYKLDAKYHIIRTINDDKFGVLDIANDCFVSIVPTNADCFFLGCDCYSVEFADWSALDGDIIFGSKEPDNQQAPKHFKKFCDRINIKVEYNEFYGSIMYVKRHCCEQYFDRLRFVTNKSGPYQYFDDMYERLAAALLGRFKISVAPNEYEYKVVFPWTRTENPKMIHMSFGLDWYKRDKIFVTFKNIITDFVTKFPKVRYLYENTDWLNDAKINNLQYKLSNINDDRLFRRQ